MLLRNLYLVKGPCSSKRGNNKSGPDTAAGKTIVLIHHYKGQHAA